MLFRLTLFYIPAQILGPVVQLLAVAVWTFLLSPAEVGVLNLVVSIHELLFYVAVNWWGFYAIRCLGSDSATDPERINFQVMEPAVLLVLMTLQTAAVFILTLVFVDGNASPAMLFACVSFSISRSLVQYAMERNRALHHVGTYTALSLISSVAGTVFGIGFVLWLGNDPIWPIAGFAVGNTVALVLVLANGTTLPRLTMPDRANVIKALNYGWPIIVGAFALWTSLHGHRFIVDHFLGRADVGLLGVSTGLAERCIILMSTILAPAILPLATRELRTGDPGKANRYLHDGWALNLALMIPAAIGGTVLAKPLADLIVGPEFRVTTGELLPLALLSAMIAAQIPSPNQCFLLHGRTRMIIYGSLLDIAAGLSLSVLLVSLIGLKGALIARIISSSIVLTWVSWIAWRDHGLRVPVRHIALSLASAGAMAGVLSAMATPNGTIEVMAHILLGATIYAICMIAAYRRIAIPQAQRLLRAVRHRTAN